jgi:hypothetical protein
VLALAPPAFAQNSRGGAVEPVAKAKPSATAAAGPGGFPFTGLDITFLLGGGGLLLGSGVAFGRLRARRGTTA